MSTEDVTYHFRAGTPGGDVFAGTLKAGTQAEAIKLLKGKGFQPLRVEDRPIRESWLHREITFGGARRLSLGASEAFCRELALLLRSGMPIAAAMAMTLASGRRSDASYGFASAVRHGITLGRSLSEAVASAGYAVPDDLAPIIRAGETSGRLAEALDVLARSYAETNRVRRALVSAAAYPVLLLVVSLAVFALIAFFVAPSLAQLFVSMEREIPLPLAILSGAARLATDNAIVLAVLVIAAVALGISGGALRGLRQAMVRPLLSVPILGEALNWAASRRFVAALHLHLASHVPLPSALPGAFASASFPGGSRRGAMVVEQVRRGSALAPALRDSRLLPDKVVHLIEVGESSGRLTEVLAIIADEARARFEQRMGLVTTLLAPLLILLVGSLIGTVIFSVFSALLQINELAF
jgi:type II secretory pathway component PulF